MQAVAMKNKVRVAFLLKLDEKEGEISQNYLDVWGGNFFGHQIMFWIKTFVFDHGCPPAKGEITEAPEEHVKK